MAQLAQQLERLRAGIVQLVQATHTQVRHLLAASENVEQGIRHVEQQVPAELAETLDRLLQAERQVTMMGQQIQHMMTRLQV